MTVMSRSTLDLFVTMLKLSDHVTGPFVTHIISLWTYIHKTYIILVLPFLVDGYGYCQAEGAISPVYSLKQSSVTIPLSKWEEICTAIVERTEGV